MKHQFVNWLNKQLSDSGWTMSEMGRRAGLSHATISNVLSGKTNPGFEFCIGIAKALGMPPEVVMRKAGLMPPRPDDVGAGEFIAEIAAILRNLPVADREIIYETAKLHYEHAYDQPQKYEFSTKHDPDPSSP